jgi:hypothetical protein
MTAVRTAWAAIYNRAASVGGPVEPTQESQGVGGRGEVIKTLDLPGFGTPCEGDTEVLVEDPPDGSRKWRHALLSVGGVIHLLELPTLPAPTESTAPGERSRPRGGGRPRR